MTSELHAPVLLALDEVTAGYDGAVAIADVTLDVRTDSFTGVVGPSGSGKTTLLRTLLQTVQPMRGDVTRSPGLAVSYVPQLETVNWNFPVTVGECVLMSRTGRLQPWASKQEKREVTVDFAGGGLVLLLLGGGLSLAWFGRLP